jgi:hypothetical protein
MDQLVVIVVVVRGETLLLLPSFLSTAGLWTDIYRRRERIFLYLVYLLHVWSFQYAYNSPVQYKNRNVSEHS